ncbi:MAG: hypothetical protein ACREQ9_25500, partial [Candidatus Binatia bacterium]
RCPSGIAIDPTNDQEIIVSDSCNHAIRRLDLAASAVSTIAGTGAAGFVDGPGATARFDLPTALERDGAGRLFVADSGNDALRVIAGGTVATVGRNETVTIDLFNLNGQGVLPPLVSPPPDHFALPAGVAVGDLGALGFAAREVVFVADAGYGASLDRGRRIRQVTRAP